MSLQFLYNWLILTYLGLEHKSMRNHRNRQKTTLDKYASPLFLSSLISSFSYVSLYSVLTFFFNFETIFFMANVMVEPAISDPLQAN